MGQKHSSLVTPGTSLQDSDIRHALASYPDGLPTASFNDDEHDEGSFASINNPHSLNNSDKSHLITARSSLSATIGNAINSLMGIGLLSLPFALRESGWAGMILLLAFGLITFYTAITLAKCCDRDRSILTYADIGGAAFGRWGRGCTSVFFYVELMVASTMYIIAAGDNINTCLAWPLWGHKIYYVLFALIALPSVWIRDLSLLANLSWIGIVASVALFVIMLMFGLDPYSPHTPGNLVHPTSTSFFRPQTFTLSLGLIMVGFVAHPVFPTLYRAMSKPQQFPVALGVTYFVVVLFYGATAMVGYLIWGDQIAQEVTLNLGPDIAGIIGAALFVLLPFTKYALTLTPVAVSFDQILAEKMDTQSPKFKMLRLVIRLVLVIITLLIAVVVPNFSTPLSIVGSLCSFTSSVTLPSLCYLKLCKDKIGLVERIVNVLLVLVGVTAAITGTVSAIVISTNKGFA